MSKVPKSYNVFLQITANEDFNKAVALANSLMIPFKPQYTENTLYFKNYNDSFTFIANWDKKDANGTNNIK